MENDNIVGFNRIAHWIIEGDVDRVDLQNVWDRMKIGGSFPSHLSPYEIVFHIVEESRIEDFCATMQDVLIARGFDLDHDYE